MWIIELSRTTIYGTTYVGYYHENAQYKSVPGANYATIFDKVGIDTLIVEGLRCNALIGWDWRKIEVK